MAKKAVANSEFAKFHYLALPCCWLCKDKSETTHTTSIALKPNFDTTVVNFGASSKTRFDDMDIRKIDDKETMVILRGNDLFRVDDTTTMKPTKIMTFPGEVTQDIGRVNIVDQDSKIAKTGNILAKVGTSIWKVILSSPQDPQQDHSLKLRPLY